MRCEEANNPLVKVVTLLSRQTTHSVPKVFATHPLLLQHKDTAAEGAKLSLFGKFPKLV